MNFFDQIFAKKEVSTIVETPSFFGSFFNYAISGILLGIFVDTFLVFSNFSTKQPIVSAHWGTTPLILMGLYLFFGIIYSASSRFVDSFSKTQKLFLEEWKINSLKAPKTAEMIFFAIFFPLAIAMVTIFFPTFSSKGAGAVIVLIAPFLFRFLLNETVSEAQSISTGKKKIIWAIPLIAIAYYILWQLVQTL